MVDGDFLNDPSPSTHLGKKTFGVPSPFLNGPICFQKRNGTSTIGEAPGLGRSRLAREEATWRATPESLGKHSEIRYSSGPPKPQVACGWFMLMNIDE